MLKHVRLSNLFYAVLTFKIRPNIRCFLFMVCVSSRFVFHVSCSKFVFHDSCSGFVFIFPVQVLRVSCFLSRFVFHVSSSEFVFHVSCSRFVFHVSFFQLKKCMNKFLNLKDKEDDIYFHLLL